MFHGLNITRGPDHVLGFTHFDYRAARFLIIGSNGIANPSDGQSECVQSVRVYHDLVLFNHPADRSDFSDTWHGL